MTRELAFTTFNNIALKDVKKCFTGWHEKVMPKKNIVKPLTC
jgi:hypothetical protein